VSPPTEASYKQRALKPAYLGYVRRGFAGVARVAKSCLPEALHDKAIHRAARLDFIVSPCDKDGCCPMSALEVKVKDIKVKTSASSICLTISVHTTTARLRCSNQLCCTASETFSSSSSRDADEDDTCAISVPSSHMCVH